ncbi:sigma-70 family RNA polymerase sigma factor [Anthocerotibacter panamensis]|uniref:sigma-70 family RNA polymerase sigma factor n=1 Tax=Anthocerotibacter panamensis TaxID=2857077 RepID=UPI001C404A00|nr:sigma-70 family RNA polymerase sigma factor [Anthocerotibacter panamensis]
MNDVDKNLLLSSIARQDRAALDKLYDCYARILHAVAFKILGSTEESEEVILDVFMQVWRTASSFDPSRGQVDSWLFLLTRSRALDRLRALQRSQRSVTASQTALQNQPADPQEYVLSSERRDLMQKALCQLPPEQREVLELAYYRGLSHHEIAQFMDKPLGTVKTRIRLGLTKLRENLSPPKQDGD